MQRDAACCAVGRVRARGRGAPRDRRRRSGAARLGLGAEAAPPRRRHQRSRLRRGARTDGGERVTPLAGRTALVTGGAKRVGASIASAIEAAGARVIVTSRSALLPADLSTRDGVESLLASLPPIDLLVNAAANFVREPFGTITWETFDATVALNARAPLFLSQTLGLAMKERGYGRIVNIADI